MKIIFFSSSLFPAHIKGVVDQTTILVIGYLHNFSLSKGKLSKSISSNCYKMLPEVALFIRKVSNFAIYICKNFSFYFLFLTKLPISRISNKLQNSRSQKINKILKFLLFVSNVFYFFISLVFLRTL